MKPARTTVAALTLLMLTACNPDQPDPTTPETTTDPNTTHATTPGDTTPGDTTPEASTADTNTPSDEEPTPTVEPIPELQSDDIPRTFPAEFGEWVTNAEITETSRLYTDDDQRYYSVDYLRYADIDQASLLIIDPAVEGQFLCGTSDAVDRLVFCYTPTPGGVMQFGGKVDEMSTDELITHAHSFIDAWTGQ